MSFHLICEVFLAKNQKIFKVGKIRKYDEETEYFEIKNAFIFQKGTFYQKGKAQNMPVVAGPFVDSWSQISQLILFLPQVRWNDIDYMDRYQDFTYSNETYAQLPVLVTDLHKHKQKYIMILDSGISDKLGSDALVQGSQMGIWIRNATGYPLELQVWPSKEHKSVFLEKF